MCIVCRCGGLTQRSNQVPAKLPAGAGGRAYQRVTRCAPSSVEVLRIQISWGFTFLVLSIFRHRAERMLLVVSSTSSRVETLAMSQVARLRRARVGGREGNGPET